MSWIKSTECAGPRALSDVSSFVKVQEWAAYIFFAECPQHAILCIVDLTFLVAALSQCLWCNLHNTNNSSIFEEKKFNLRKFRGSRLTVTFVLTFVLAILMSIAHVGIAAVQIWHGCRSGWSSDLVREEVAIAVQSLAWILSTCILNNERKYCVTEHPMVLRVWWACSFLLFVLQFLGSLFRLTLPGGLSYDLQLNIDDIFVLVKFPVSLYLLIISINGVSGISARTEDLDDMLREPFLNNDIKDPKYPATTTGYAKASIYNRAVFMWLNPLLLKGAQRALEVSDVPQLASNDRAERMYNLFQCNWPQKPGTHPVRMTLLKCFWPQLAFTGILLLIKSCVMYIGPLLIQSFTNYVRGDSASRYDGYSLVIFLLVAKSVEVLSSHHYNFQCYKLGNNIRTAIMTVTYRKGLRLSASARQSYGVGQITNFMVVDAQQLSDAMLQLHLCWALPLQVVLALIILYKVIGLSAFAGLGTMVLIVAITMYNSGLQKEFQACISKVRDLRVKAINEALNYMRVIKLQAWDKEFQHQIERFRQSEFQWLTKFVYSMQFNMFTLWNTPSLVSAVAYSTCVLLRQELTTGKIFTAASTFRVVQEPIRNFPQAIIAIAQAFVALERLDKFMVSVELEPGSVLRLPASEEFPVTIEEGCFAWEEEARKPVLSNINVNVRKGSLVAIVGTVGSGKSSLLASMLGEMVKISGQVKVCGTAAYVSQSAWIQNATIQDNILFGLPMDRERYQQTLHACALELDIAAMDHGDQTEIGERGINLSGGQKQRIQLARAVYHNCDVYLLDDVFSAVDAHTGSHLFKECILGVLSGKTILLVTHQVEFLVGADLILVMHDGKIAQAGKYENVLQAGTVFEAIVAAHNDAMGLVHAEGNNTQMTTDLQHSKDLQEKSIVASSQQSSFASSSESLGEPGITADGSSKLIEEEQRETGHVDWKVYWLYMTKAYGCPALFVLLLNQAVWQGLLILSDYWLADEIPEGSNQSFHRGLFIRVYVALTGASWVCVLIRTMLMAAIGLRTTQLFFLEMLHSIFRAPMSFFDTTPSGRILSRFTADQTNLDIWLHYFFGGSMGVYFSAVGMIVVITLTTWPIIFLIIPLAWVYYKYQSYFITTSREITRLDSITKAPVIYHFSETVAGIATIRCFGKEEEFSQVNLDRVNTNMKMDFHNNSSNEWLGLRLEAIGTAVLCTAALLFVVLPDGAINSGLVGLALSYALGLNTSLYWSVWLTCTVENKMVSVERIRQYTVLPSEAPLEIKNCLPSPSWPEVGKIVTKTLKLRYRPNTPLVLKGVSFTIEGGQKVGVVGRTGSGKSTLVQAIFRLIEPASGQILVDDVDIATLGLHDLRSRFGVIPQEPVLFEGSIRNNIDLFGVHTDEEIWKVLEKCQLVDIVREKFEKLDAPVVEYGENWSLGQRQLFCFARALLKHCQILFLDEATASVDSQTDAVIQTLIRDELREHTVVSIAHRIPTVIDYDRVLVMDAGRVKEFSTPASLLSNSNSLFSALVKEYASRSGQRE
eukprot:c28999_g1_i2 orf=516-5060(-)